MPRTIISLYSFDIPHTYSAGHPLSQSEATALNWLKTNTIRNVVLHWLRKRTNPEGILTPEEVADYQKRIYQYALDFKFISKSNGSDNKKSLLDIETGIVAAESLARQGIYPGDPDFLSALQATIDDPDVQSEARRRIKRKQLAINPEAVGL